MRLSICHKLFDLCSITNSDRSDRKCDIMKMYENETTDLKKEVVAFANTNGGTIYIGVQYNGRNSESDFQFND
jgi:predicted HTH transcriptional regulator